MCGRKRKAAELVRNWQGLYRCPEHNEPRQPQDFARGVPDKMGVPWAQPETDIYVGPTIIPTFPVSIIPNPLVLSAGTVFFASETGSLFGTENGLDLFVLDSGLAGEAFVVLPDWVIPVSYLWSWQSGGVDITISNDTQYAATFSAATTGLTGVAQCVVQNNLGGQATATVTVNS